VAGFSFKTYEISRKLVGLLIMEVKMKSSYPAYLAYKDSSMEWLGEIPSHWKMMPLKELSSKEKYAFVDGPFGSDLKNEEYQDEGIPLIQLNNIGVGEHIIQNLKFVTEEKAKQLYKHNILPGNIVIAKMADPVARAALVKDAFQRYVIVADCVKFVPNQSLIFPKYLVYALNAPQIKFCAELVSSGTTRLRINLSSIKNIKIALPPYIEQRAIADFLDRETACIDALIARYQRLIELLEEKRTSLINQAVTKGLDSSVELMESGIPWLGSIPSHWLLVHLRRVIAKFVDYRGKTPEKVDDGVPLITARNIKNGMIDMDLSQEFIRVEDYDEWMVRGLPEPGDVLITMEAPLGETAQIIDTNIALAQRIILLKTEKSLITNEYLKYTFLSKFGQGELWSKATGSTAIGIKASHLREIMVLLPPIGEQLKIVRFIDREKQSIDRLIARVKSMFRLLTEYRISLISSVVTGKIDVMQ
jgi:type I restriction enzyme, S subunit